MIHGIELGPGGSEGEEGVLTLPRLFPSYARFEVLRCGLLDTEPTILERFLLVLDEADPVLFFAGWDAVRFRQYT